jgi:hypothetical protein
MAQIEIPEPWRKAVCAILASDDEKLIYWEPVGRRRYEAIPGCDWGYEAHEAFRNYLSQPCPTGCHKVMDEPPGETYDFFFPFKGRKFYGKILLRTDRKRIVVFSAHLPEWEKLSCERD